MTVFSFLNALPDTESEGATFYRLEFHPHANQKHPLPPPIDEATFAAEGPEALEGALLAIPVESQLMFDRPGSGPGRGGVLRLLLNVRHPNLSRETFAHHWRTVHAPLAIERNPHYDYYITNISTDPESEYDGVLQEWFPTKAAFLEHEGGLQTIKKAVSDDYSEFLLDSQECPQWLATELA